MTPKMTGPTRAVLAALVRNFGGGPVGIETIAAALSEPRDAIEDIIEPFLIQKGFVQRTPRGRVLGDMPHGQLRGIAQLHERPVGALVRGDRSGLQPGTVDVPVEVLAGAGLPGWGGFSHGCS